MLKRLDKKIFSIIGLKDRNPDKEYWLSVTPQQRLEALEFLRQLNYNYDPATSRLQRVFETAKLR